MTCMSHILSGWQDISKGPSRAAWAGPSPRTLGEPIIISPSLPPRHGPCLKVPPVTTGAPPRRLVLPEETARIRTTPRGLLEELRLVHDTDGFLHMALLNLELVFEADPLRRRKLLRQVRMLEAMDQLDWPAPPALHLDRTRPVDLEAVLRGAVELAASDLPSRVRGSATRPVPLVPRSDPRATGSGPL